MASKTFNISLPDELVKKVDKKARQEMTSRSDVLRRAALDYLRNNPVEVWEKFYPKTSRMAREAGAYTEEDVVHLVNSVRREIAEKRSKAREHV